MSLPCYRESWRNKHKCYLGLEGIFLCTLQNSVAIQCFTLRLSFFPLILFFIITEAIRERGTTFKQRHV